MNTYNRSFRGNNRPNFNRSNRARVPRSVDPSLFVREAKEVTTEAAYIATHTFSDFAFHPTIAENIKARGYSTPTPIQDQVISHLLAGKDVVGVANTGTGKTAAFLLPILQKLMTDYSQRVLIVVPTRELATQVDEEFRAFARRTRIYSQVCIGGVGLGGQIFGLRKNPQIVIGTPGRILDLENQRALSFGLFQTIVLDEVDRMFDMGFLHDVKYIISKLPAKRHSMFFSATVPPEVRIVMNAFLHEPVTVTIKTQETAENVKQDVVRLNGRQKVDVLHDLLKTDGFEKVLVFGRTKHGLEKLARNLEKMGVDVAAIHGNKSQGQRQRALSDFKQNRIRVLLATDIASRGLDIDSVSHVINYDAPESYEDYIHRIGRTGRANKKGIALTFVA